MSTRKLTRTSYATPGGSPRMGFTNRSESSRDVQEHALPLTQVHGSGLHDWGVATGLHVTATTGDSTLVVTTGIAVDATGRHLTGAGATVPVAGLPGTHHLAIACAETFDEAAGGTDERLKTDNATLDGALESLGRIRAVSFVPADCIRQIGVLAGEVRAENPELVVSHPGTGCKSVNYTGLIGVVLQAVRELAERVDRLGRKP